MKVLFVTYHGLGFGGAEVSTNYLAEGLKRKGHEIIFISTGDYEGFKNYKLDCFKNVPLFFIHDFYVEKAIKKVIKIEKPELIHVHDRLTSIGAVKAAKTAKIPVVVHFRDYWFACPNSSCMASDGFGYDKCDAKIIFKHFPARRWLWDIYKLGHIRKARKILDMADLKFANSNAVRRRLEICGINDAKQVNILRNLNNFSPKVKKGVIKQMLGIDCNLVLYAGGLTEVKGVKFIVEVISEVLNRKKGWCFLIFGEGPLVNNLKELIELKGLSNKIILAGKIGINEMPYAYADADIVVLPSLWEEPLSGVLLEAGASGKPVVASDRGGNREVIRNGLNGYIAGAGNAGEWKKMLIKLINDKELRKKIGDNARKEILQGFSMEQVSGAVEKEYLTLIKKG